MSPSRRLAHGVASGETRVSASARVFHSLLFFSPLLLFSHGGNRGSDGEKRELEFKDEDQEYAQVAKMLGNGRLEATCFDGTTRLCHIRGKFRKRVWINAGDIILLGLREYQDGKADVIHKYTPDEARTLKGEMQKARQGPVLRSGNNLICEFLSQRTARFRSALLSADSSMPTRRMPRVVELLSELDRTATARSRRPERRLTGTSSSRSSKRLFFATVFQDFCPSVVQRALVRVEGPL